MGKVSGIAAELKKAGIAFKRNYSVKKLASFKIGGRVDAYVEAGNIQELQKTVCAAGRAKTKFMIVGNMTNLLITDKKINRVFIKLAGDFRRISRKGRTAVYAGAAVKNGELLNFLLKNGLGGLEFLAGIPGTIGGATYMNAGAYGKGIGAYAGKVFYADKHGKTGAVNNMKGVFTYRHSRFQDDGRIITGVLIKAEKRNRAESAAEMKDIIKQRHIKHPWDAACAGSFFKNTADITAGKLIEMAGLKGKKAGGAMVSEKHANFLINAGGARFSDVIRLSELVKKTVYKKFKIRLKEEVIIIR
jgi:UDP-N-acetylmuramate dehydrogenase